MRWQMILAACLMFGMMQVQALDAFPQATLQDEKKQEVTNYRLVLSGLKRTQATTYGEQERRVSGSLWRRVWAVDEGFQLKEVEEHFRAQLQDISILYQCHALDCGSSNFWGNDIFANARLVGREQNQFYLVALHNGGGERKTLYVLYIVQRGTRQIMVNLDILTTTDVIQYEARIEDQISHALSQSAGWLPGLEVTDGRLDSDKSAPLLTVLRQLSPVLKHRLYLVVHCYDASHMADNIQCSERLAEQIRAATFDGRYEISVSGQGALTPAPDNDVRPALRFVFWPGR